MPPRRSLLVLVAFSCGVMCGRLSLATAARAQPPAPPGSSRANPALQVGAVTVRIGESRSDVESRLEAFYSLAKPNDDFTLVGTRPATDSNGVRHDSQPLGNVRFSGGRVSRVERNWGDASGANVLKLWESLYGLIESRVGTDHAVAAAVSIERSRGPEASSDAVRINIGRADLTIEHFQSRTSGALPAFNYVGVAESVF